MTTVPELTSDQRETLLRRAWYGHDGRWFATVAAEFGLDAANRVNRKALRAATVGEMRGIAKTMGVEKAADLDEFLHVFDVAASVFVPRSLMEFEVKRVDDRSYEVAFERCFVHENITKAGIAEHYVCAVFDRVAGWHDALGLPLADEPPALPCAKSQGKECRRTMTIQ
jgi:limonene-1,2-epoxide hydrolase